MSTRSKYNRVNVKPENKEAKSESDIILKKSDSYGKYIGRALTLFFENKKTHVVLKAAEKVIERAIWVAQVLKRKVAGLHQITRFTENKIVDIYEPKEEGLVRVELERFLTVIEIVLTKQPTASEKAEVGYQGPIKVDEKELLNQQKWEAEQKQRNERRERYEKGEKTEERKPRRENNTRTENERREKRTEGGERKQRREGGERRQEQREGGERKRGRNY